MDIRKIHVFQEIVFAEMGEANERPINRIAAAAVVNNPFAGNYEADLTTLYDWGEELGNQLVGHLTPMFALPIESYGKAGLVGTNGDIEHVHAMMHPKLGKQMRDPIGGGKALIPSAAKIGYPGCSIEIPLGHKDDAWSFDHFDAMTILLPDAPRPNELVLVVAFADGGRLNARCGLGRLAK